MLADAQQCFVIHIDVYQGRNDAEVEIHDSARGLPTTQKAVINAITVTDMSNDPEGYRHLLLDNRYQCPELALLLKNVHKMLSSGTVRKNRKGWDGESVSLTKGDERGSYSIAYDKVNEVLILEWKDNKIVKCCSTLGIHSIVPIKRRVGPDIVVFPCPSALVEYQQNMGGVDRGDQTRLMGAGFATKAHYKKWYKKAFFAILDFMLLNSFTAWNMAVAEGDSTKYEMLKWEYYAYIAEELCSYKDECHHEDNGDDEEELRNQGCHRPVTTETGKGSKLRCRVYRLESRMTKGIGGTQTHRSMATCDICGITAHLSVPLASKNFKIFGFPEFTNQSCMEIAHHNSCNGLWRKINDDGDAFVDGQKWSVKTTHNIWKRIRAAHGKPGKQQIAHEEDCDN